MALPKISTPTYTLTLPSTGKEIKYRPFLVREEKLLVLALESEDMKQITESIKTVLGNCIETKSVKIETLPTFDIEFLFLNIRGKSVGEEIEVKLICPDDGETTVPVKINVEDIKVQTFEGHEKTIKVDDQVTLEMKYPSLDQFIKSNFDFNSNDNMDQAFDLVASCVNKVYTEDEAWTSSDVSLKEIVEFLDQFNSSQFKKIEKFFETMPKLMHKVKIKNPKTKVESEVTIEGLSSFFA